MGLGNKRGRLGSKFTINRVTVKGLAENIKGEKADSGEQGRSKRAETSFRVALITKTFSYTNNKIQQHHVYAVKL